MLVFIALALAGSAAAQITVGPLNIVEKLFPHADNANGAVPRVGLVPVATTIVGKSSNAENIK
jgi:hypothetical protein